MYMNSVKKGSQTDPLNNYQPDKRHDKFMTETVKAQRKEGSLSLTIGQSSRISSKRK